LKDASGKSVTASSASSTEVVFDNISADTFKINQDSTSDLYLYADAKTNTNRGSTIVGLNSVTIRGSNGKELTTTADASVKSNKMDVYENTAKIAQVSPVNKSIATDAMRFSITAAGKNSVTLSSITLTGTISGYTGAYTVEVHKVSDDTLVASGSSLTTLTFIPNTVVDSGKTETYYIKLAGIAIDSGSQQSDWSIKLTSLTIKPIDGVSIDLANYPQNTDTLPLTSSK